MCSSGKGSAGGAPEVREVAVCAGVDGARIALALEVAAAVVAACNIKSKVLKIVLSVSEKVQTQPAVKSYLLQ